MAISLNRAQAHVAEWQEKLSKFPNRAGWANSLFHACQLEVVPDIVADRNMVPRGEQDELICDVANQGAVWNNPNAHEYVRLYFRPKNRFHLKTEGIKSSEDPFREDPHMSMPMMLVFDFQSVLSLGSSSFVPGNFARTDAEPLSGDASFNNLEFSKIYHDSPHQDPSIHDARMSEVVVRDSLSLDHLKAVFCRTVYEGRTLFHLLGSIEPKPKILVERRPGNLFFRQAIFLDELYLKKGILHFRFHSPSKGHREKYDVAVRCGTYFENTYQLKPGSWRIDQFECNDPDAIWEISIEGCLAYRAKIPYPTDDVV